MSGRSFPLRHAVAWFALGLLLSSCGSETLSLTEYVDRLNGINDRTLPEAAVLISELEGSTTPKEVEAAVRQMAALRAESVDATEMLEPPATLEELHWLFLGWEKRLIPIEVALAAKAGAVAGWPEFFESTEVKEYRAALVEGRQVCLEFQARMDATASRGVFEDTPWLPGALSEVVEARLGCDLFPENPDQVFRPAPESTVPEPSS